jgi:GTP-binding protein Era
VVSGDLNDIEHQAIVTLNRLRKPIVLALNKIDTFRKSELAEITASIKQRLAGIITDDNIVYAAARPGPRLRVLADGSEQIEDEPPPVIADVEKRVLEILQTEGKAVAALNASLFAADVSERFARLKVEIRQSEAKSLITKFMAVKALAVAVNPVPLLDIAGGMSADAAMLYQLARVYDQPITLRNARTLGRDISLAWGITATVEWVMHILSNVAKTATFGLSTVLTAVPQGLAAGWSTYVIGQAANVYFRDGGWGAKGPKATIEKILDDIDRASVLAPLREQLLARLKGSRHA